MNYTTSSRFVISLPDPIILPHLKQEDLKSWYPELHPYMRLTLVEALPSVLPMFSKELITYTEKTFKESRIDIMTGTMVHPLLFPIGTLLTSTRSKVSVPPPLLSSQKMHQNNKLTVASSFGPLEIPVDPLQRISWPSCQTTRPTSGAFPSIVRYSPWFRPDLCPHQL